MSYCKEYGKDQVIFLTEEDAAKPSSVELAPPNAEDVPQGLITESGEINWNCPCLGGMAVGPCGVEFRDAFSCFHYSEADPKGSECFEKFVVMQECMKSYPELYDKHTRDDDDDDEPQSKKENSESPKEEPEKLEKPESGKEEPEQLEKPANKEDQAQPEEPQKSEETDKTGSEDVATDNKSESVEESNEKKVE